MMRSVSVCAVLAAAPAAQMTVEVNDPMSKGVLGDDKVSLHEAIQVLNTKLAYNAFSAAEQNQFRGLPTTVLDTVEINFNITPVITIEEPLPVIIGDTISHVDCIFRGLNGRPVIDGTAAGVDAVFPSATNHTMLHDLIIRGGKAGLDTDSSEHYHPGVLMTVENCLFEGQTEVGVRIRIQSFPPGGIEPDQLLRNEFRNLPIGVELVEQSSFADLEVALSENLFNQCDIGLKIRMTGQGGQADVIGDRNRIVGATTGIYVERGALRDSTLNLDLVHGEITATNEAIDIEGGPLATTKVSLRHFDLASDPTGFALRATPASAWLGLRLGETHFSGPVAVAMGSSLSAQLDLSNCRFENGAVNLDYRGPAARPSPTLERCVFENAPLTIAAGSTRPFTVIESEFQSSPIDNQSSSAATLNACFLGGSATTGMVTSMNPIGKRWIGQASVSPYNPPLGGQFNLNVSLRPNTCAVWMIGVSERRPLTQSPRLYFSRSAFLRLPISVTGTQALTFPVPTNPIFSGVEVYCQPAVVPEPGQSPAPAWSLPRGGLLKIQ
ncbi:MAG: hypothetical protein AAF628_25310 [Planctomycetota bacterium]